MSTYRLRVKSVQSKSGQWISITSPPYPTFHSSSNSDIASLGKGFDNQGPDFASATAAGGIVAGAGFTSLFTVPSGTSAIRLYIDQTAIELNGVPTDILDLPAGFTPSSATMQVLVRTEPTSGTATPLGTFTLLYDTFTASTDDFWTQALGSGSGVNDLQLSFLHPFPFPEPTILDLVNGGMGVTLVNPGTGIQKMGFFLWDIYITGTYTILSYSWYYNPDTNQYAYLAADPGDPWILQDPVLAVNVVDPAAGCAEVTDVTVTGEGFGNGAIVLFDSVLASDIVVVDQTTITCTVPAHADGSVDVTVINPDLQEATLSSGFEFGEPYWIQNNYITLSFPTANLPALTVMPSTITSISPSGGALAANQQLTITGTGFVDGLTVEFLSGESSQFATSVAVASSTQVTCITPSTPFQGLVAVIVNNPGGTSAGVAANNEVDLFNIQVFVQSCTAPDDTYSLFGLTAPDPVWWTLPSLGLFYFQQEPPSKHWETTSAPGVNGWYFSTNEFDGNVFTVNLT